ncbi:MAG TPA: ATP-binding protein [Thermoanaerobaculia bacterium]|nr:ATP-binding protein [Thermoanaerobaculia bacterium]
MKRVGNLGLSRRLLIASAVFGLFVLFDIALFGWLIFRSLSQREIERVLLETREEAETLAQRIAERAKRQGDLYTAVAVERETQTYIDSILRQRDIVRQVKILDKNGVLVFQSINQANVQVPGPDGPAVGPGTSELPGPASPNEEKKTSEATTTYQVPDVKVPIGNLGLLQIGISTPELNKRIEVLRRELIQQAAAIGGLSALLLLTAYAGVWLLMRRAQRLEVQAAEAERMAYIGTLASGLAHEIRNPLNSLNLNMQMLEEEIVDSGSAPTGQRLLSITRSELSRLERLVTDFLAYAKPRPLELEEIPAILLLERVPEVLAGEIQRRRARVAVHDRSHGARVRVDLAQINQLLLNLAQNALLAAEEADRTPILELSAHRQGPWVELRVADNGAGIRAEDQPKIFDLFYSTRKGGTGLGLAIVDRIARAHGGHVAVESTPGNGTVMTVELPAVTTPEPLARAPVEASVGA